MENQEKLTTAAHGVTNSPLTRSPSPPHDAQPSSPAPGSPVKSSVSSDLSHRSSPSHGSSPETKRPDSPPGNSPVRSPALQPMVNRLSREEPVAATKVEQGARSPGESSISSDLSHHSFPSHGSSPEGKTKNPERSPSPQPMVNRFARDEPVANRFARDEPVAATTKVDGGVGDGVLGGDAVKGGAGRRPRKSLSILRRVKREEIVKKVALGFRVFGFACCLVSLAVMAADKNEGWALDSFYRYKEFRYSLSVNAIGFVYSFAQALDLVYHLATGEYVFRHRIRYYVDFAVDQILTYLLMSASSSAATRVDDWQSNWGEDKFPEMATASVAMSYMAFVAFASSSLISGYALCTSRSV